MRQNRSLRLFLISFLMSSAACTPAEDYGDEVGVEATENEAEQSVGSVANADAGPDGGGARAVSVSNEAIEFTYFYPEEAGSIAPLAAMLDARLAKEQADAERDAEEYRLGAQDNGYKARQHTYRVEWESVADLPGWVSLSAMISTDTGGAHPNYGFDSLVWDKKAGEALNPIALFRSPAALQNALGGAFCAMLNTERAQRRGEPIDTASEDIFDTCPSVADLTVVPASSNGKTFDQVTLLAAPYVAGPYVEGSYEFTLPVTAAVLDAVKPNYASSFSIMATN